MNLLVISHTPHYKVNDQIVGWGPTVREIDHLSQIFSKIIHIAPLHPERSPSSSLPYTHQNILFVPVPVAGGERIFQRIFSYLRALPQYVKAIWRALREVDIVHVRCPAGISLIALILLIISPYPKFRWVKYAGNWIQKHPPVSYALQRWILSNNFHRGVVTINGSWDHSGDHIFSFLNPCITSEEAETARIIGRQKELSSPCELLFVGRLEKAKGIHTVLEAASLLKKRGVDFRLHIVGDGGERREVEETTFQLQLANHTIFWGWLPRPDLNVLYRIAHFILLPSSSEGWPKVLSEAMAYGTVVLASSVSSIPQILKTTGAGFAISDGAPEYERIIVEMIARPDLWKVYSIKGVDAGVMFTYEHYISAIRAMMNKAWGISI